MGYSNDEVQNRISMNELENELYLAIHKTFLFDRVCPPQVVGSKITGLSLTREGDMDIIRFLTKTQVTGNQKVDATKSITVLEMEHNNCPPGYVILRLRKLRSISAADKLIINAQNFCLVPKKGIYLSSSSVMLATGPFYEDFCRMVCLRSLKNKGPAHTHSVNKNHILVDELYAIPVVTVPEPMAKWILRNRHWPDKTMITNIMKQNCEVVPVGYRGSEEEYLQWRLSFSTHERMLMQNLNGTQRKLYVLLKKFFEEVLNLQINIFRMLDTKILSSYHAKNLILWISEKQPLLLMKENHLMARFIDALHFLKQFIEANFFPHYFIVERNLFADRMTVKDQARLLSLLNLCLTRGASCVLLSKSILKEVCKCLQPDLCIKQKYANEVYRKFAAEITDLKLRILGAITSTYQSVMIFSRNEQFHISAISDEVRSTLTFVENVKSFYKVMAGMTRNYYTGCDGYQFEKDISNLLTNPYANTVTGKVETAAVMYALGDIHNAYGVLHRVIEEVESRLNSKIIVIRRYQSNREWKPSLIPNEPISLLLATKCIPEIIFTQDNILFVPQGLRYDWFRCSDICIYGPIYRLRVDCMILEYYLHVLVCNQLRKEKEAERSMAKLILGSLEVKRSSRRIFEYRETALNCVGHVYMTKGNYRSSFIAIKRSIFVGIEMEVQVNPSILQMATLINKVLEAKRIMNLLKFTLTMEMD